MVRPVNKEHTILLRMLNTVLRLTPSPSANSAALPLNGAGSMQVLAQPLVARSPSTPDASMRFASFLSPTKFLRRTKTSLRAAPLTTGRGQST